MDFSLLYRTLLFCSIQQIVGNRDFEKILTTPRGELLQEKKNLMVVIAKKIADNSTELKKNSTK